MTSIRLLLSQHGFGLRKRVRGAGDGVAELSRVQPTVEGFRTSRHRACPGGSTASAILKSGHVGTRAKSVNPPGQARWRVAKKTSTAPRPQRVRAVFLVLVAVLGVTLGAGTSSAQFRVSTQDWEREANRVAVNHFAFQDRRSQVLLERAREQLAEGQTRLAIDTLQSLLGDPQELLSIDGTTRLPSDSFYWHEGSLRSVRRSVFEMLPTLSPGQLDQYESAFGITARQALDDGLRRGDFGLVQQVARSSFATQAGFEATDQIAVRMLDSGHARAAANLWRELIESPVHRRRITRGLVTRTVASLLLAGHRDEAEKLVGFVLKNLKPIEVTVPEVEQLIAAIDPAAFRNAAAGSATDEWLLPFGNVLHNGDARGSAPYLEPVWTQPLSRSAPFSMLDHWETLEAREELTDIGVAIWPIICRGQIVTRDLSGVRGIDPKTGRALWHFESTLTTPKLISEIRQSGYGATTDESLIELTWIGNSMLGAVTSDGHRVFAIDWLKFEDEEADEPGSGNRRIPAPRATPNGSRFPAGVGGRVADGSNWHVANRIVCIEPVVASRADAAAGEGGPVENVRPLWSVGGSRVRTPDEPLSGHLFLGAPVASDSGVFVMTESVAEKELNLVKLNGENGRVLWVQTLGLVEQTMFSTTQRFREQSLCLPTISNGTVVCPTEAGYVVAVDELTGELRWLYYYGAPVVAGRMRTQFGYENHGYKGLPDLPHIHNGQIVYLPRQSSELHCVDLATGERRWKTGRLEDDRYVAAVTDDVIAIVGKAEMRGVSLSDGSALWTRRLDLPSGRGCRVGDLFYAPLKNGSVAAVELKTGRLVTLVSVPTLFDRRFEQAQDADGVGTVSIRTADLNQFGLSDNQVPFPNRPGNLLFHDGLVLSTGPQFLTAFAQSDVLLRQLKVESQSGTATTPASELRAARIELSAGLDTEAEVRLTRLLASTDKRHANLARWQLRQLILDRLSDRDSGLTLEARQQQLAKLAELSITPADRHRDLIETARQAVAHTKPGGTINAEVLAGLLKAADLGIQSFIPGEQSSGEFVVSVKAWTRNVASEAFRNATGEDALKLQALAASSLAAASAAVRIENPASIDGLERSVDLFSAAEVAGRYRNQLADRLIQTGRPQDAELYLLQNLQHPLPQTRAVARVLLIGLWHQAGLPHEAGRALVDLQRDFPSTDLSSIQQDRLLSVAALTSTNSSDPSLVKPLDVAAILAGIDRDSGTWSVYLDLLPATDQNIHTVLVSGTTFDPSNPDVDVAWDGRPRRVSSSDSTQFNILRNETVSRGEWKLMDRENGAERGTIRLDGRNILPVSDRSKFLGHFMSLGGAAEMRGVSLLEVQDHRPKWTVRFPLAEANLESMEPGLVTPSVCVFQTRKHLFGVSPSNGEILWRRSDLDLASGIHVDREAGLFGDERVIVMFHRDQKTYTLYATQTGEVIRRGRLDIDFRYSKRVFGRRLFFRTQLDSPTDDPRYRVWEPLTDTTEFEEPLTIRIYHEVTPDDELAIVNAAGRLRILQMPAAKVLIDLDLGHDAIRTMTGLNLFADDETFFVNLHSSVGASGQVRWMRYHAGDVMLPVEHVHRGQLLAIDRRTGRVRWQANTDQRTYLRMDAVRLPFLVGLSQMGARSGVNQRTLEVELLDRKTGEIVGEASGLLLDRLVFCKSLREQGLVELHGTRTRIDLDFSRGLQGIRLQQGPL